MLGRSDLEIRTRRGPAQTIGAGGSMRRILIVTCLAATVLAMLGGPVAAAPTQARNYEAIPAVCDGLGPVVIEVVSMGNWSTAKIQGTKTTLIPRSFTFKVTDITHPDPAEHEVVDEGHERKRATDATDVCRFEFVEEIEGDPEIPDGTYLIELTVEVKVVGRR
jgi:hypothetical protein